MAPKRMKYIRDIPVPTRQQLCEFFDDLSGLKNWKHLAGLMGFSNDNINAFQLSGQRLGGSPTNEMLTEWDHGNHTIEELFHKLYELQHVRCMMLLKQHVNPSLHRLIDDLQATTPEHTGYGNLEHSGPQPANIPPAAHHNSENHFGPPYPHHGQQFMQSQQQHLHHNHQQHHPSYYQQQPEYMNNYPPVIPPSGCYGPNSNPMCPPPDPRRVASVCIPGGNVTTSDNMAPQYGGHQMGSPQIYVSDFPSKDHMPPPCSGPDIDLPSPVNPPQSVASSERSIDQYLNSPIIEVPFTALCEATDNFSDKKKLGEGAFGKVYYGEINMTEVAIKKIIKNENVRFDQAKIRQDQIKEITALRKYPHRNIVSLNSYSISEDNDLYLIFPYMRNGSLEKSLERKSHHGPLSWRRRHSIMEGAAEGIHYLHTADKKPLIHQDIKSANILLDENFVAKIADFGLARPGPAQGKEYTALKTSVVFGTKAYLAPEFVSGSQRKLSPRLDVYSFGVVLAEVVTGEKAGASKDRFKYDNLLATNVERIMDNNRNNPQKAVEQLLDPSCPDWPPYYVLKMLELATLCTEDFKRRPEMENVLKELRDMNKAIQQQGASSGRNVQPTENTEPIDSRPGEESSCPSLTDQDSKGHTASYDGRPCASSKRSYAGMHCLENGPDLRQAQAHLIHGQLRATGPEQGMDYRWWYNMNSRYNYPLPVPTPSTGSYMSPQLPDSTTSSSPRSSYPSSYGQQHPSIPSEPRYPMSYSPGPQQYSPYQQPWGGAGAGQCSQVPGVGNGHPARFDPRQGYVTSGVSYQDGMQFHHHQYLQDGDLQQRMGGSFRNGGDCNFPVRHSGGHPQPPDLTHRGIPGHANSSSSLHLSSQTGSDKTGSDEMGCSSKYVKQQTLHLSSIESSDTSVLTSETSMLTLSDQAPDANGRGTRPGSDSEVGASACRMHGEDPSCMGSGMGAARSREEQRMENAGAEPGRIPVQSTEPQNKMH